MKDNNYIFVIGIKDFNDNYVSLFGSIGFIMCICNSLYKYFKSSNDKDFNDLKNNYFEKDFNKY